MSFLQLGQFQARQGALASAGLTNGVLAGNAAAAAAAASQLGARKDALISAGILSPNHQGPLPTDLRGLRASGGSVGAPGPTSASLGTNLHSPVVSQPGLQGYTQSSLAAALGGQQAGLGGGVTSRLNGSSLQQLQNTGRLGAGLGGGNAAVNLLQHQGMPGTSAPPSSVAPSQDLLSLLSRQKQVRLGSSGAQNTAQRVLVPSRETSICSMQIQHSMLV